MSRSKRRKKQSRIPEYRPAQWNDAQRAEPRPTTGNWRPPAVAIILMLIGGVVYGLQSNRWTASQDVEQAAARIQNVPLDFGDWEGRDIEIPQNQLDQAGAVGHLHRVYKNRTTGDEVLVMVLCGPHGPIALHPPTVCFTGAGWKLEEPPEATAVKDAEQKGELGSFFVTRFRKTTPTSASRMRTCWAWNGDGRWESPESPRFAFAGSRHLYKIYVSTRLSPEANSDAEEAFDKGICIKFLREFLPVLKKAGI